MNREIISINKKILEKLDPREIPMFKAETFFALENNDRKKFYRITRTYIRKYGIDASELEEWDI